MGRPMRKAQLAFAEDSESNSDSDKSIQGLPIITRQTRHIRDNSDNEEDIPLTELQKHLRNKKLKYNTSSSSDADAHPYDKIESQYPLSRQCDTDSTDNQMQIDEIAIKNKKRKSLRKRQKSNKSIKKVIFTCLEAIADHM